MNLHSNQGFGITSALVGMSLISITFMSALALSTHQGRLNSSLSKNQDLIDLHSTVQMMLSNQAVCGSTLNFRDKRLADLRNEAPLSLPSSPAEQIAAVGLQTKSWIITEAKLDDLIEVSPRSYIANYSLSTRVIQDPIGSPVKQRKFRLQLRTQLVAGEEVVTDCSGGGWSQMVKVASGTVGSLTGSNIRHTPLTVDLQQYGFVPGQPFEIIATVGVARGRGPQGILVTKNTQSATATLTCQARGCENMNFFAQQVLN